MGLWIRSTAKTNFVKCDCLSIIEGKEIYKKNSWEYDGYVICQCYGNNPTKSLTPLGTYKTKERALEVLDEIQKHIDNILNYDHLETKVYQMPQE